MDRAVEVLRLNQSLRDHGLSRAMPRLRALLRFSSCSSRRKAELQTDQSSGSAVPLSRAGYHKAKEEHGLVAVRHTPGLKRGPVAQRTYCAQICRYPVEQVDGKLGPKRHVIGA